MMTIMTIMDGLRVGSGRLCSAGISSAQHWVLNMLQELQTLALVGLLVSTYYLTVGCRRIGDSLPTESGQISDKVAGATEVLDDIADLLNEALQSLSGGGSTQTPSSPMEAILSGFITSMTSKANHGTQSQEWEVLPPNENTDSQEATD